MALAHQVRKRHRLTQDWANYCASPARSGEVMGCGARHDKDDVDVDMLDVENWGHGDDDDVIECETKGAVIELANIARIPVEHWTRFHQSAETSIITFYYARKWQLEIESRPEVKKKFEDLERAVWALNKALQRLTLQEYRNAVRTLLIVRSQRELALAPYSWRKEVASMVWATSVMVGKNPNRETKRRPGQQEGNVRDWLPQQFVRKLWLCAYDCGGKLTAGHKNNKPYGTMFKALERLESYFPDGVIPRSTQTIANIVKSMRDDRRT